VTAAVAVAFGGVICQDDKPVDGAFEGLHTLMGRFAVFVHTTREPLPVAHWLYREGGFEVTPDAGGFDAWDHQGILLVTRRVLPASAYIDDRAVRFVSWEQTLAFMDGQQP
jgi:hypothetical protein